MADQTGTLQRIHDHCGLILADDARAAMARYLAGRPREKYGKHVYTLEQFGLTADVLDPLFAEYMAEYGAFL